MALSAAEWGVIAATISAMADVIQLGRGTYDDYFKRRIGTKDNETKASILERTFGTFSDSEVSSIEERINECRKRFIAEGSGKSRKACLCSVLLDVFLGNGGSIPDPEWQRLFEKLGCAS
jgi:hypothetical protein